MRQFFRPKDEEEALILWNIMESEFFRKQIYYLSITASQPEIREIIFKEEVILPWPKREEDKKNIVNSVRAVEQARHNLNSSLKKVTSNYEALFNGDT